MLQLCFPKADSPQVVPALNSHQLLSQLMAELERSGLQMKVPFLSRVLILL